MTRINTHTSYTADTEFGEVKLEFKPVDFLDLQVRDAGRFFVVGYLVHDPDCENPLYSCDGLGEIHHHPRSRYGDRKYANYYGLMGCDSYGERIVDEDKLQMRWRDKVLALPLSLFQAEGVDASPQDLCDALADENAGDYTIFDQCRYAWRHTFEIEPEIIEAMCGAIEEALGWDYQAEVEDCYELPDPYAVLLDLYDHSGCVWSVSGTGMNCRWDTSRGESVWVPDKCLREQINEEVAAGAVLDELLVKYCQQCLDEYNAWSSGDCYGIVTQIHDKETLELVEPEEACWGFIGSEWAEQALDEAVECAVKHSETIGHETQLELAL